MSVRTKQRELSFFNLNDDGARVGSLGQLREPSFCLFVCLNGLKVLGAGELRIVT